MPINIHILTRLFYQYSELAGKKVSLKLEHDAPEVNQDDLYRRIKLRTKIEVIGVLIAILGLNLILSMVAKEGLTARLKTKTTIELIAHRGGGDLGAESST